MKKKGLVFLGVALLESILLCACGEGSVVPVMDENPVNDEQSAEVEAQDDVQEETADDETKGGVAAAGEEKVVDSDFFFGHILAADSLKAKKELISDTVLTVNSENEDGIYSEYKKQYVMYIYDEIAELFDCSSYDDSSVYYSLYRGKFEETEYGYNVFAEDNNIYMVFVADDKITHVTYATDLEAEKRRMDLAGVYTAKSDELGDLKLTISEYAEDVILEFGTEKRTCSLFETMDGKWDLVSYAGEEDATSIDWIVEFNGNTFSYKGFYENEYEYVAGEYTINGDLGELNFVIEASGTTTMEWEVDGEIIQLSGSAYTDPDTKTLTSIYLYDESGNYALDLNIDELDGELRYYGRVTKPLGAG